MFPRSRLPVVSGSPDIFRVDPGPLVEFRGEADPELGHSLRLTVFDDHARSGNEQASGCRSLRSHSAWLSGTKEARRVALGGLTCPKTHPEDKGAMVHFMVER